MAISTPINTDSYGTIIISTIRQQNNQDFPVVDCNDIKGGYYQVDTFVDLDNIPNIRKKIGMMCYVKEDGNVYRLNNGNSWEILTISNIDSLLSQIADQLGAYIPLVKTITDISYIASKNEILLCNSISEQTITLPEAETNAQINIKKISDNNIIVNIVSTNGQTIDESVEPIKLTFKFESVTVISDGYNWYLI